MPRLPRLLPALLSALLLASCASAPPSKIVDRTLPLPAALLTCAPEPAVPGPDADDRAAALFLIALADAGADCRGKLGEVRALQRERTE